MARRPRSFFVRPAPEVAPDLLGHLLVRRLPTGEMLRARIVETEAYEPGDPASHGYRGRTPRTAAMFGPPGHLYVYFTYGMHHCMNVVTRPRGQGSAVLLRAAQPIDGVDAMAVFRGTDRIRDLCRGPARMALALGVDRTLDGTDLVHGRDIWLEEDRSSAPVGPVLAGPRIGIRVGTDRPWRFWLEGPWVSATRRPVAPSPRSA